MPGRMQRDLDLAHAKGFAVIVRIDQRILAQPLAHQPDTRRRDLIPPAPRTRVVAVRVSHQRTRYRQHRIDKKFACRTVKPFGTRLEQRIGHAVKLGGEASMLRQCP